MRKIFLGLFSLVYFSFTPLVFAAVTDTPTPCPSTAAQGAQGINPCAEGGVIINITQPAGRGISGGANPGEVIGRAITIVFSLAALIVLVMIMWGAFEWIFSAGDKEKIGAARGRIVNALIGLALLALAFLVARIVGQLININIFSLNIPSLGPPP